MTEHGPLQLVVFDCDGTLVDSQNSIVAAMAGAWAAAGRSDPPPIHAVRRVVGLPLVDAIAQLLPEADETAHADLAQAYKSAFRANLSQRGFHEPLYPGVRDVLNILQEAGALLGIATGKGRVGLDLTLEYHGLEERFSTLQTSDIAPGKPSPEMLYRAMRETGAAPENTVMIGDTSFDILMARNAGVTAVGVSWGYHESKELTSAGAHHVIDQFDELPAALTRLGVLTGA